MATHTINLALCHIGDVLTPPPAGHRGTWFHQAPPTWAVGDVIVFVVYQDEERGRGVVEAIDGPAAHGDPGWYGWHRTRWIPIDQLRTAAAEMSPAALESGAAYYAPARDSAGYPVKE